jgi:toxin ParE1/3/4
MRYEFHPEALKEYAEAVQFFVQQDRHQDFIDTIENTIFKIISTPKRWPIIEGQIRRCLTLKFSYAILYRVYSRSHSSSYPKSRHWRYNISSPSCRTLRVG